MNKPSINLRWQNNYKINIPTIDAQHKQLFNTYTNLNQALRSGLKPSVIEETLNRLQYYVTRHFTMEEKYMADSDYPDIAEQVAAHKYFSTRFSEILQDFKKHGLTPAIVQTIQNELGNWLQDHVSRLDMDFGRYYNSKYPNS